MTTQEVAQPFIKLLQEGKYDEAQAQFFSDDIVSIEPEGVPNRIQKGMEAIKQKSISFYDSVEKIHTNEISEPIIAESYFSFTLKSKMSFKGAPEPTMIEEVVVCHVNNGKIDMEEFYYTVPPQQ